MESDLWGRAPELMRAGVAARVARLAGTASARGRRLTSPVLLAALSAGAFAPLLTAGVGAEALIAAGIAAGASVGGNVLTDVIKEGVQRLSGEDEPPSRQDLEASLERRIEQLLADGGQETGRLRAEIAAVLQEIGAVGAAVEAALHSGDQELLTALTVGFAETGRQFTEFTFLLTDLQTELRQVRDGVDQSSGQARLTLDLLYQQQTQLRVLLDQTAFSPDGKTLATSDEGRTARLWDVGYLADPEARLCAQLGRSLTRAAWAAVIPAGPAYRQTCP